MKINVGVSNHHVHLTSDVYEKLFGSTNYNKRNDLNQPGEFAMDEVVDLVSDKGIIKNVRVLGPFRDYNQVELTRGECIKLGLDLNIRKSGNLDNTSGIKLVNGDKEVILDEGVIIAERHIHMDKNTASLNGLKDNDAVIVKINGSKGSFKNVLHEEIIAFVKISDKAYTEMHIDCDDANAFWLNNNDEVDILI